MHGRKTRKYQRMGQEAKARACSAEGQLGPEERDPGARRGCGEAEAKWITAPVGSGPGLAAASRTEGNPRDPSRLCGAILGLNALLQLA
ncbi:unnamed protein product [Caretta caretta]